MRLLLDTHFVLEALGVKSYGLSESGLLELAIREGEIFCSVVSLWECEIKNRIGKLPLSEPVRRWGPLFEKLDIDLLAVEANHITSDIGRFCCRSDLNF